MSLEADTDASLPARTTKSVPAMLDMAPAVAVAVKLDAAVDTMLAPAMVVTEPEVAVEEMLLAAVSEMLLPAMVVTEPAVAVEVMLMAAVEAMLAPATLDIEPAVAVLKMFEAAVEEMFAPAVVATLVPATLDRAPAVAVRERLDAAVTEALAPAVAMKEPSTASKLRSRPAVAAKEPLTASKLTSLDADMLALQPAANVTFLAARPMMLSVAASNSRVTAWLWAARNTSPASASTVALLPARPEKLLQAVNEVLLDANRVKLYVALSNFAVTLLPAATRSIDFVTLANMLLDTVEVKLPPALTLTALAAVMEMLSVVSSITMLMASCAYKARLLLTAVNVTLLKALTVKSLLVVNAVLCIAMALRSLHAVKLMLL